MDTKPNKQPARSGEGTMSSKVTTNISDYDLIKPYMDSVPCESGHHNTTTGADIAW